MSYKKALSTNLLYFQYHDPPDKLVANHLKLGNMEAQNLPGHKKDYGNIEVRRSLFHNSQMLYFFRN